MSNENVGAKVIIFAILFSIVFLSIVFYYQQENKKNANAITDRNYPENSSPFPTGPAIIDNKLRADVIFKGLTYPTDLAFLGSNDILVIEKDTGIVRRIVNDTMMQEPLLDVSVATFGHRGMLGIEVSNVSSSTITSTPPDKIPVNNTKYVFIYYTAIQGKDGDDITRGTQPIGNVVYRYEFVENRLIRPKLLLNLPATPGAIGNGGKILVNPYDDNLYITIGGVGIDGHKTKAQNVGNGGEPDGTSGILVITQDGKEVSQNGILGNKIS
jgi:glucose/arabinose dehydrogenase